MVCLVHEVRVTSDLVKTANDFLMKSSNDTGRRDFLYLLQNRTRLPFPSIKLVLPLEGFYRHTFMLVEETVEDNFNLVILPLQKNREGFDVPDYRGVFIRPEECYLNEEGRVVIQTYDCTHCVAQDSTKQQVAQAEFLNGLPKIERTEDFLQFITLLCAVLSTINSL